MLENIDVYLSLEYLGDYEHLLIYFFTDRFIINLLNTGRVVFSISNQL